jgi:hypothetical protein
LKPGILNSVLVAQVRNTADWLWSEPAAAPLVGVFDAAVDEALEAPDGLLRALRLRLAAHYATVATFVPTDVDAHIRHHMWMAIADPEVLSAAVGHIDEAAGRDPTLVSERVTSGISGHNGEWLSVWAGALGRALTLGAHAEAQRLRAQIDGELAREERVFAEALDGGAPARTVLALATTLAHNLGDLSRVVDAWPRAVDAPVVRERYTRLGHADGARVRRGFLLAGALNKEIMALENHRFLVLRKPRALRRSRSLLLPVGPWFDAWGEALLDSEHLDNADRAEVVTALIELHLASPAQQGCLRALAGVHRATRGGLGFYAEALPARVRKEIARGRIREAVDLEPEHFEARIEKRLRAALAR